MAEKELDGESLSALLSDEIAKANTYWSSDTSDVKANRTQNIEYMRGEMTDVLQRPGGSKMTSRDVSDVVNGILPQLMRIFMSSDRMGMYEPQEPEDEAYVEQATDYANHIFFKDNDGEKVLYDSMHDALSVSGDGIVKHWWDETPITKVYIQSGMTAEDIATLTGEEGVEILAQDKGETQYIPQVDPATGQEVLMPVETWDVKIERVKQYGCERVEAIAPENFLINVEALEIEDFRFCAHRDPNVTKSKLISMGFDEDAVERLMPSTDWSMEAQARRSVVPGSDSKQESQKQVELYECYLKIDVDGDGESEVIKAYYAGAGAQGEVLPRNGEEWELWEDDVPFTKVPCYPRPHNFESESVADRVKDVQRIKTVFLRQLIDNLYASALPMQEVVEGAVLNPDSLVKPKFGGLIWTDKKYAGTEVVRRHEVPFVADKLIPGLELMDRVIEARTGMSRAKMGLDPDVLQNQTAEAVRDARSALHSQDEMIARNMARGYRKMFRAILKSIVKHQDRPRMIRLRNEWVPMDPRSWNADMDCTINVGLGTGSRDRDAMMLGVVLQDQKETIAGLLTYGAAEEAIDMLPKITRAQIKRAEAVGIRNADEYFPDWDDEEIAKLKQAAAQPKPDPEIEKEKIRVQGQIAIEQGKAQVQMQTEQAKLAKDMEAERLKAEGNMVKENAQLQADLATKDADRQNTLILEGQKIGWEREKWQSELKFKYDELAAKTEQARLNAEAKAKEAKSKPKGKAA